jgi:hypothetical protein
MDRLLLEFLRAILGESRGVNMPPMPAAAPPEGPTALAKGNMGQALPGSEALPKEDKELSLGDIFGPMFDNMPLGKSDQLNIADRPSFTTRDTGPVPQAPAVRASDPNPGMSLPVPNPERMPLPEQNTFGAFGEFLGDMATQGNVTGPGFPAQGAQPQPFGPQASLEQALAAQVLRAPPPVPTRSPVPEEDFATMMRRQLLGGA